MIGKVLVAVFAVVVVGIMAEVHWRTSEGLVVCEVTEVIREPKYYLLAEGTMKCGERSWSFSGRGSLGIGRYHWSLVALGRKWECHQFVTPILRERMYKPCTMVRTG